MRWCHRVLFADNVRSTPAGGLVVFDFDNSGPGELTRRPLTRRVVEELLDAAP